MKALKLFLMILFSAAIVAATAQVDVMGKVKNQTNNRANNKVDQSINKGLDKIEEGIGGMFKKKKTDSTQPTDQPQQQSDQTQQQPENGAQNTASAGSATPSLQSYSKYDFVPGDRIILYEDFSQDAIGDFPALWTTNKSGEVNTLNIAPGNWFNLNETEGNWWLLKEIDFPENYIVEFDVIPKNQGGRYAVGLHLYGENSYNEMSDPYEHVQSGLLIAVSTDGWEAKGFKDGQPQIDGSSDLNPVQKEKLNHVILWVQKRRVRIYHEGAKVLDLPTLLYQGSKFNRLCFELYRGASCSSFISNLKITTASPDTRSKLLTEGKLVSYGIYFDVNKDIVKPESYGALNDIAKVLKENPTVRVKISGHTDSDGDETLNLDLSKRRGASVKNELVNTFGIEAAQLETDGMGESQPVAPNDTPVNKALNRRVEFIKL
jgi:flagellar motor protein MotB